jgi:uncharacterized protein YegJ (DUF2314 family)
MRLPSVNPAVNCVLFLAMFGYAVYSASVAGQAMTILVWYVVAGLSLPAAVAYFFERGWARWLAIAVMVTCAGSFVPQHLIYSRYLHAIALFAMSGLAVYWFLKEAITPEEVAREEGRSDDKADSSEDGESRPMTSLVLLLREPRYLDPAILAHAAGQAWDAEFLAGEEDSEAENFVVGDSPMFVIKHAASMYVVHNHPRPYFDASQEVAEQLSERRRRKAILEHRSWMSVDAMLLEATDEARREAYGQIGRMVAQLAGDDTMAVICPESGQIVPYDAELDQVLRSGEPLEAFDTPSNPPVIEIAPDDPRMQAAVAEAREHWPEFVAAFESRKPEDRFSVKAPFRDDECVEFMWVEVTAVEGDLVLGTLGNEPVSVTGLTLGGRVRVSLAELNDWIYVRNEQLYGGYTIKVFERIQKEEG